VDQHVFELDKDWEVVLTLNQPFLRAYVNLRHKGKVSPPGSTRVIVQSKQGGPASYVSMHEDHDPCEVAVLASPNYEKE
jgi:hypothetical protein